MNIAQTWFLARLFVYLSSLISQIPFCIDWFAFLFLMAWQWKHRIPIWVDPNELSSMVDSHVELDSLSWRTMAYILTSKREIIYGNLCLRFGTWKVHNLTIWNKVIHCQNSLVAHSNLIHGLTQIRYAAPSWFKRQSFHVPLNRGIKRLVHEKFDV